jgi:crossover junction endodeoxyribonuclease RuvC
MPTSGGYDTGRVLLGIDPGLRVTGYGIIRVTGPSLCYLGHGAIRTANGGHAGRLLQIHETIRSLLELWLVDEVAIEKQFVALNASSAFAVGEARAAAMLAGALAGVPVVEYTPAEVKQAVTSYGRSGKAQIQEMVRLHFGWTEPPQPADAADALAIAICHAARRALPEPARRPGTRASKPGVLRTRTGKELMPTKVESG